jgi:hypothetical protein
MHSAAPEITESADLQALLMPEEGLEPSTRGLMTPLCFGSQSRKLGLGDTKGDITAEPIHATCADVRFA